MLNSFSHCSLKMSLCKIDLLFFSTLHFFAKWILRQIWNHLEISPFSTKWIKSPLLFSHGQWILMNICCSDLVKGLLQKFFHFSRDYVFCISLFRSGSWTRQNLNHNKDKSLLSACLIVSVFLLLLSLQFVKEFCSTSDHSVLRQLPVL